jgi:hypothetical protein
MNNNDELIKTADIQKIAEEGARIYGRIKENYDPKEKGKFLAIDIDSKQAYLGATSAEALEMARQKHPNKVFYVVKIGFDVAETMARSFSEKSRHSREGGNPIIAWASVPPPNMDWTPDVRSGATI